MDVELLVIPGCPGADAASELLRTALDDIGLVGTSFSVEVIDSAERAMTRRFAGSPAFLVDGVDLFPVDDRGGSMACRLYPTPDGPRNVPAPKELRRALREQSARIARA
jgi:hypothetical protein